MAEILGRVETSTRDFLDFLGNRLSAKRRAAFDLALAFVSDYWPRRVVAPKRTTLIHGDAHMWNFLHPVDTDRDRAYLIDLATSSRVRPGTNDLAYMVALQWYPERRAALEKALVRRYHGALVARGVVGYGWEDCWEDYRASVISHLFTPAMQWASGDIPASTWWHNLERIAEAFDDLGCAGMITR